ncbi:MAG: GyrI-like domain-containing protein [Streptococcaceae bacterium]|nr:GyrI-like domain-containing protein [Streptococcaceae bacterium]
MTDYTIEHKEAFTLTGYGFGIEGDFAGAAKLKQDFLATITNDGRLEALQKASTDGFDWSVNDVYQGKPHTYFAVATAEKLQSTRVIDFPAGDYVVIPGVADKSSFFDTLAGIAFGQVLPTITNYAYVGGPNATWRKENADGTCEGEIWIPVVTK